MIELFRFAIGYLVKQSDTVGLRPESHLPGTGERRIFNLKQLFAVEGYVETRGFEVNAQAVPGISRDRNGNPITSLPADNVEGTEDSAYSLVENDIVLKRIGPGHIIIVRISRPPATPAARSWEPPTALNFTSTNSSLMLVSFFRSSG
jgi:hypothetical protein